MRVEGISIAATYARLCTSALKLPRLLVAGSSECKGDGTLGLALK